MLLIVVLIVGEALHVGGQLLWVGAAPPRDRVASADGVVAIRGRFVCSERSGWSSGTGRGGKATSGTSMPPPSRRAYRWVSE